MLGLVASPYADLLRDPPFRRFWAGLLVSATGDELTKVALVWFVYEQTGSAAALGILMLCLTGPIVIGGFVAGWLLDRFDRRLVMTVDNVVRGWRWPWCRRSICWAGSRSGMCICQPPSTVCC